MLDGLSVFGFKVSQYPVAVVGVIAIIIALLMMTAFGIMRLLWNRK
jgi:hypothetical protein